jgi:simple sugar transport system ATP-binding protein
MTETATAHPAGDGRPAFPGGTVAGELPPGTPPALELAGVHKAFDGKPALIDAGFTLRRGELHALVGENGAGKSTLMNVATGVYAADAGRELVDGELVRIRGPVDAAAAGLGMVHQHFRLVPRFTVAENVRLALGRRAGSPAAAAALVAAKAAEIGFPIRPDARVADLSVAERQRAEILKVLLLGARVLILDEPTAVLTEQESDALLAFTARLAAQGGSVVLITHKLREVAARADRVTVMRQGRTVLDGAPIASVTPAEVARLAVGAAVAPVARPRRAPGGPALAVEGLSHRREDGAPTLDGLTLSVREGEVLGLAGVGGNGQSELVACLAGLASPTGGTVSLAGRDVTGASPAARRDLGLRVVPADRFAFGLVRGFSVADNLALAALRRGRYGSPFAVARRRIRRDAEAAIREHEIHGATPTRSTGLLSGGNAQKVLLARELDDAVRVLVAHSPTRGLDVRAAQAVQAAIAAAAERGVACLLISEDLEELMALSGRIAVINRGRIVGEMPVEDASAAALGALMVGHA